MPYNLPSNLKKLLSIRNVKQSDFGKVIANTSPGSVSGWVNGTVKPPIDKILLMCKYFEINLTDFVTGEIGFPSQQYDRFVEENHPELSNKNSKVDPGVNKDQIIAMLQKQILTLEEDFPKVMNTTLASTIEKVDEIYNMLHKEGFESRLGENVGDLNQLKSKKS
ncbi:MAG: hypothetical protein COA50_01180 [Flavobacteriaceae bacterium]|nr:MAG: hypothetical protein COA50_01180 [Flavobacteriaceae bacterium]